MQTGRKIILIIMKKYLSIIALALFFSGNAYADDSYETAFKKALDNHFFFTLLIKI